MELDRDACLRALRTKDPRFDGLFVCAVVTTGIYCRPSCPATPLPRNVVFHRTAAAAQAAGFRACKRCRPDAVPGSPEWDVRADLAARAVRLVRDGVVDREGVPGLADRLGYSRRQVERALLAEVGAGPLALARAQRAQTARVLVETTRLPLADVALAAGFGSVRQFNDVVRAVYGVPPGELRRRGADTPPAAGALDLRLPFRRPLWPDSLLGHLVATAVPGVEEWRDGSFRRTLRLPRGTGVVALTPRADHVACRLHLSDLRDLPAAIARCRRLLDLDADPVAVDAALSSDPVLRPMVAAAPGRRVPRAVDEQELALRVVLGQQVSTAAARTHAGRLAAALGEPVHDPEGGLTRLWPTPEALAQAPDALLAMPDPRRRALRGLAAALCAGDVRLDAGVDRDEARRALLALPGIGPWTADVVLMRGLGDPDAFLPSDLGVRQAAARLGLDLATAPARWAPWRAYAVQHLWGTSEHAVNRLPAAGAAA